MNHEILVFRKKGNVKIPTCEDISECKRAADHSIGGRARICLHDQDTSLFQDMIIVALKKTKIPIHLHLKKDESLLVLEGKVRVSIYDEGLKKIESRILVPFLEAQDNSMDFMFRIKSNVAHSVEILSDKAVIYEATIGPFLPEESIIIDETV